MFDKLRTAAALLFQGVTHPRAAFLALRERGPLHIARWFVKGDSETIRRLARDARFRSAPATLENLREYYHDITFSAADDPEHHIALLPSGERFFVRKARGWQDTGVLHEVFIDGAYAGHPPVDGATVLDVGANIGDTLVYFAKRGARVVAYEPDPEMCELARRNARLNAVNADIRNAGIGAAAETLLLSASPSGADTMSTTFFPGSKPVNRLHVTTIPVQVVALADVLAELGTVRLAKFDCEGCEYPALLSVSDEGLRNVAHIMMEYHGPVEELAKKLRSAGFAVRLEGDMYMLADRAASVAAARS